MRAPSNRFAPIESRSSTERVLTAAPLVLAIVVSALTVVRYWVLSAPYPPGLDGAQWLTYGRELIGGAGRGAESVYAPLVPIVVHGLSLALGPFLGLRVAAALLLVLLAISVVLLCVRGLGLTWGPVVASLVLPCTAFAEPFFYGGLPQQAAMTFGLLGIACVIGPNPGKSVSNETRILAGAAMCFVLASASHLVFGPLMLCSAALSFLGISTGRTDQRCFLAHAALALVPAVLTSLMIFLLYLQHGYAAPLEASRRPPGEAWIYATRESPWLWAAIVAGGVTGSLYIDLSRRSPYSILHKRLSLPPAATAGFALVIPAGILLAASGQPRLSPPVLLGGAILASFACKYATRSQSRLRHAILSACCLATIWMATVTTGFTREFAHFYEVLDTSFVVATRAIPSQADGAVAVAADHRGWPVGWWVEALQPAPVLVGSDLQWLAFPEERARAETVNDLLASSDSSVLQQRARDAGVAYLVLHKWDWIGWERWLATTQDAPTVIYDDNETIVLRIVPAAQ
jgi:hypothetical protein